MKCGVLTSADLARTPIVNTLPAAVLPPKSPGLTEMGGSLAVILSIGNIEELIFRPGITTNSY